ncbi:hypothetical protein GCM10011348_28750 [Marinobacterium nitratireducens]|uniref:Uncharacterized protein n=1 Tax=Marinobacterium nitratireducens TaxID=518897 RepID=A0A917ZII8_9GAMM|nr:hypothetical protein GCM10011348_28750 [Marinobacterium nitratireducens]
MIAGQIGTAAKHRNRRLLLFGWQLLGDEHGVVAALGRQSVEQFGGADLTDARETPVSRG